MNCLWSMFCFGRPDSAPKLHRDVHFRKLSRRKLAKAKKIDKVDAQGRTILHVAAMRRQERTVDMILDEVHKRKLRAMMNMVDHDGNTALHLASHYRDNESVVHLLTAGCDDTILNKRGQLPLERALASDDFDIETPYGICGVVDGKSKQPSMPFAKYWVKKKEEEMENLFKPMKVKPKVTTTDLPVLDPIDVEVSEGAFQDSLSISIEAVPEASPKDETTKSLPTAGEPKTLEVLETSDVALQESDGYLVASAQVDEISPKDETNTIHPLTEEPKPLELNETCDVALQENDGYSAASTQADEVSWNAESETNPSVKEDTQLMPALKENKDIRTLAEDKAQVFSVQTKESEGPSVLDTMLVIAIFLVLLKAVFF